MSIYFVFLRGFFLEKLKYEKQESINNFFRGSTYLPQTEQAVKSFQIPKTVNEKGGKREFLCQDMD